VGLGTMTEEGGAQVGGGKGRRGFAMGLGLQRLRAEAEEGGAQTEGKGKRGFAWTGAEVGEAQVS
jgi:hypothetical protein